MMGSGCPVASPQLQWRVESEQRGDSPSESSNGSGENGDDNLPPTGLPYFLGTKAQVQGSSVVQAQVSIDVVVAYSGGALRKVKAWSCGEPR